MADTLESLEIEIVHSSGGAATEIGKLTSSISKLSASLTRVIPKLKEFADALGKISNPVTINDIHDSTFNKTINNVKQVASAYKGIKQAAKVPVADDLRNALSQFSEVEVLMGKLTGLQDAMEQAFNAGDVQKAIALRGQIIQTQKAIDKLTESTKKATGGLSNFFASLKRIAMYRALRTIIKEITQAIKEGIDNLYEFSKANNDLGGVSSALDSLASAAQTTKNQLGATFGQMLVAIAPALEALLQLVAKLAEAFYPLVHAIAALEPVITTVVNAVTELINVLIALFDLLVLNVGKIVAQDATKQWKEAKTAAGDYKRTILGFDEINRLNAPSGGGGGYTGGNFGASDSVNGGGSPFKMDWVPIFMGKIDDAKGALADLVAEYVALPEFVIDLILGKDEVTEPLDGLIRTVTESFPLVATIIMALQGNPIPFINMVRSAIAQFVHDSIGSFSEWQAAYASACESVSNESYSLAGNLRDAFAESKKTVKDWMDNFWQKVGEYQQASGALQTENSTLGQDTVDTYNRMKNPLNDWVSHAWQKVGEYQRASGAMQVENATLSSDISLTYSNIKQSISTALSNVKTNLQTFRSETLPQWGLWVSNVAENTRKGFANVAENVYLGLTNAAQNIASFVNSASSNVASWVGNTATNIANWATNIASNVGKALSSAWENFKNFMSATGEAVSGWWSENKTWAIPAAVGATIAVAAIALAPFTGGASLAGLALAANGGEFPNDGSLILAGEAGAEVVADMGGRTGVMNVDQMQEAVRQGVFDAMSAIAQSDGDRNPVFHIYLDSREIKAGQNRLARAAGV